MVTRQSKAPLHECTVGATKEATEDAQRGLAEEQERRV